jgi:hypothetical protein
VILKRKKVRSRPAKSRPATPATITSFLLRRFLKPLEGCVQKTSLDWRLQLAESKCPDGAGKALQLTRDFRMSDSKRLGFYRRGPSMSVMAIFQQLPWRNESNMMWPVVILDLWVIPSVGRHPPPSHVCTASAGTSPRIPDRNAVVATACPVPFPSGLSAGHNRRPLFRTGEVVRHLILTLIVFRLEAL